jgi:hypothetical protein
MMRTGSESPTGGVEAPVLEGAKGVMTKEGHGLGEAEVDAMVVRAGKWTRFELAWIDGGRRTRNCRP